MAKTVYKGEEISFLGRIEHVIFEKGDFSIIAVLNLETKERVSVKGNLLSPSKGDELLFTGQFELDSNGNELINQYDQKTFFLQYFSFPPIKNEEGMLKYLQRIAGKSTGYAIFEYFGMKSLDILNQEPDKLQEIPKIGKKKMTKILDKHQEFDQKETFIELSKYGITEGVIRKGLIKYGKNFLPKFKKNPYLLIELDGIQFLTADKYAIKYGVLPNDVRRIESGAIFQLQQIMSKGHCYALIGSLSLELSELLKVSGEEKVNALEISAVIESMCSRKILIQEEDRIYLPHVYIEEITLSKRLAKLIASDHKKLAIKMDEAIPKVETEFKQIYGDKFTFGTQQKDLFQRLDSNFAVLTGLPGTGKTTVTRGAMRLLQMAFPDYEICAMSPTGKASKRMTESLGIEAVTVHRALEYSPEKGGFTYNEYNRIPKQIFLVDEISMIGLFLCNSAIKAIPDGAKVLFIGDPDQLASVEAGRVLHDLLECRDIIPVVSLTEIFRQAKDSGITMNALEVNEGRFPNIKTPKGDFRFIEKKSSEDALTELLDRVEFYSEMVCGFDDIQILCPKKSGVCGTENLNLVLQEKMNPSMPHKAEYKYKDNLLFRVGDKVIQMRNNYQLEVMNGDTGVIQEIREEIVVDEDDGETKETLVIVNYDGRFVEYHHEDLKHLQLGYAITIHKSQGSEWKIVLMPFTKEVGIMGKRNLLYTGITRAKLACDLIGDRSVIWRTVKTEDTVKRNTTLAKRIRLEYQALKGA